jgi:hypothetical protein
MRTERQSADAESPGELDAILRHMRVVELEAARITEPLTRERLIIQTRRNIIALQSEKDRRK